MMVISGRRTEITEALAIWAWWFASTFLFGIIWATFVYSFGFDYILYSVFAGPILGTSQSMVIRRFAQVTDWWNWILRTSLGWMAAMVPLALGSVLGMGSMLADGD